MILRIKELCKFKGIALKDLADKLKISQVTLSRQINGNITVNMLKRIADVLNVHITDLFTKPTQRDKPIALIYHSGTYYKAQTFTELQEVVKKISRSMEIPF
jgi:transcriptional regulator with XRE-family HTH domain